MITKRGQYIHFLERISGVTLLKVALAHSVLILTNTLFFSGGATDTKCRLQIYFLERSLVAISLRVLVMS